MLVQFNAETHENVNYCTYQFEHISKLFNLTEIKEIHLKA